jgi:hypothetical protein
MLRFAYVVLALAVLSLGLLASQAVMVSSAAPVLFAEGTEPIPIPPFAQQQGPATPLVQLAEGTEPIPIPPFAAV